VNSDEKLLSLCAQRLTGRVAVRLRRPSASTALGQTYKTAGGAVIDVDPNITIPIHFYRFFCTSARTSKTTWRGCLSQIATSQLQAL